MLAGDGLDREQASLAIEESTRKQPVILPGSNPRFRDRQKSLAHLAPLSLSSPATDQIHFFIPILQELQFSLVDYGHIPTAMHILDQDRSDHSISTSIVVKSGR